MAESLPSKILSERNLWWSNCDKGNNSRRTVNIRKRDQRNENEVLKFSLAARSLNLSSKYVILSLKSGNKADYFLKCLFIYFGCRVLVAAHVTFNALNVLGFQNCYFITSYLCTHCLLCGIPFLLLLILPNT